MVELPPPSGEPVPFYVTSFTSEDLPILHLGPPAPPPSREPTDKTAARSQWELAHAPRRTPEENVTQWMRDISRRELGGEVRERFEFLLRRQIIRVYGRAKDEEVVPPNEIPEEELRRVVRRRGWLGTLIAPKPAVDETHERAPVHQQRLEQAREFADDFAHLVWKEAKSEDVAHDKKREIEFLRVRNAEKDYIATHDPLTGLKNRLGLVDELEKLIGLADRGEITGLAMLFIDIDEFKRVNDTLGHHMGDELLKGVANIIEHRSRKLERGGRLTDIIARLASLPSSPTGADETNSGLLSEGIRWGGDEFVKLIVFGNHPTAHPARGPEAAQDHPDREDNLIRIADRQTDELTEFIIRFTGGKIKGAGASVGYVLWEPGMTPHDLVRRGDACMYDIKFAKKNAPGKNAPLHQRIVNWVLRRFTP